jgi:16S rRNA (cytidine1402-2'-O)-methyltransferase
MPGVSDPGAEFVKLALEHGAHVSAIPGASVLSVALALWPKPIHTACFYGFLPRRGSERAGMIAQVMRASSVGVILESPKRLFETCRELASVDGDRKVLLLGELTKLHESIRFISLDEAVAVLEGVELKGEWAMAIDRSPQQRPSAMEGEQLLKALARSTLGTKEASEIYAEVHQIPARRAYEQMLARRSEGPAAG